MEGMIDRIATGSSALAVFLVTSGVAFVVFAALWIAFGAGVIWSQGSVTGAWEWIRGLPLLVQLVVWFLFLPVVAGLWVWETTWPLVLRLVVVVGLAGWTLFMFMPRALLQGAAR
jgi:ABC-type amino acid transport system permease subunit